MGPSPALGAAGALAAIVATWRALDVLRGPAAIWRPWRLLGAWRAAVGPSPAWGAAGGLSTFFNPVEWSR